MSDKVTVIGTRGKHKPITINTEVRNKINSYKNRLIEMASHPDETSEFDAETIRLIMETLDDYERNILIAYYAVADASPTKLGRIIGVDAYIVKSRINSIKKKLIRRNNANKTRYNMPRECIDY